MVRRLVFAVPGDLDTPTGGYAYDRRIISELCGMGWAVEILDLGAEFPRPSAAARADAHARLTASDPAAAVVIDGLAWGVLPEVAEAMAKTHMTVALVHHPLALETGLPAQEAQQFHDSERRALSCSRCAIATSPATARILVADYAVPQERVFVVRPGSDPVAPARGSADGVVSLLAVGALVPRKGYDVLVEALGGLTDLAWRLTIVGDPSRDPQTARALSAMIADRGLGSRIALAGTVSAAELAGFYEATDLFVLPSRFEGYGMAVADAIAYGLPVLAARAGAIPETLPPDAGVMVPPDDVVVLRDTLRVLMTDRGRRERLRQVARASARRLPSWRSSAEIFARVIEELR